MIAIAKNLGEAPIFYAHHFKEYDDGTVSCVMDDGAFASQQPLNPETKVYADAYGLFHFVGSDPAGGWERATLNGQIITFKSNGIAFGYVWMKA